MAVTAVLTRAKSNLICIKSIFVPKIQHLDAKPLKAIFFAIVFGNDVIYYPLFSKLTYFVEHNISNQPSKFQCLRLSVSKFTERGGKNPSPVL